MLNISLNKKVLDSVLFSLVWMVIAETSQAQSLDQRTTELMKQIVRNCLRTPVLVSSDLDDKARAKSKTKEIENYSSWYHRDVAKLEKKYPEARQSDILVKNQPFNVHLKNCEEKIQSNNTKLSAYKQSLPNFQTNTQRFIDQLIATCQAALRPTEYGTSASYEYIMRVYANYQNLKQIAFAHPEAKDYKPQEVKQCDDILAAKFQTAKTEHDALVAKEKAAQEAKQAAEERAMLEAIKRAKTIANEKAITLGYKGVYGGISNLLGGLRTGDIEIDLAKDYLLHTNDRDGFQVSSIVNRHVIYMDNNLRNVAVERIPEKYYGQGTHIASGYYSVVGTKEFTTVLGAVEEIVVLKWIDASNTKQ